MEVKPREEGCTAFLYVGLIITAIGAVCSAVAGMQYRDQVKRSEAFCRENIQNERLDHSSRMDALQFELEHERRMTRIERDSANFWREQEASQAREIQRLDRLLLRGH